MRPAELLAEAAPAPAYRKSRPHLALGLSLLLHVLVVLAGLAIWSASGGDRARGGGGGGGTGYVAVDLVSLAGGPAGDSAAANTAPPDAREVEGRDAASPEEAREAADVQDEAARAMPNETPPSRAVASRREKASSPRAKTSGSPLARNADQRTVEAGQEEAAGPAGTQGRDLPSGQPGPGRTPGEDPGTASGQGVPGTGPGTSGVLGLGEVDSLPRLVRHVEPAYPEAARRRSLSGKVMARFVVDESGTVHDPSVASSDPPDVFDACVLEAVRRWKFEPARHKGRSVKVLVTVPVRFDIARR